MQLSESERGSGGMKLSEAIDLGRAIATDITGDVYIVRDFITDWRGEIFACALGCAGLSLGQFWYKEEDVKAQWPWLTKTMDELGFPHCPHCGINVGLIDAHGTISHVMIHVDYKRHFNGGVDKFSKKGMTMDQLVEWVRLIEPKEEIKEVENVHTNNTNSATVVA